jgi:hypothetical protein
MPRMKSTTLAGLSAVILAAATTAETLRWVGLEEQFEQQAGQDAVTAAGAGGVTEPVMMG